MAEEKKIPEYERLLRKYSPKCNKEAVFEKFRCAGLHGIDPSSEKRKGTYAAMKCLGSKQVIVTENLDTTNQHAESDLLCVLRSFDKANKTTEWKGLYNHKVTIYLNCSCCAKCVEEIIAYWSVQKGELEIICASLSLCRHPACSDCNKGFKSGALSSPYDATTAGMKKVLLAEGVTFRAFEYKDWQNLRETINASDYDHVKEYTESDYRSVVNEKGVHEKIAYGRSIEDDDMASSLNKLKHEAEQQQKQQK